MTMHRGGCHCGAVRYSVDVDLAKPAIVCNCSICSRSGTMLAFVPAGKFTVDNGDDHLTSYKFNTRNIDHLFCKTCGIKSFGRGKGPDGTDMVAINVRCLDDVDLAKVPTHAYDGKSV